MASKEKEKKKNKRALFSQIGLKQKDRACHLGRIGCSLQRGGSKDSGQAPQPCCVGAVLSHRAIRCTLAPSPSLSTSRGGVGGLGSCCSYHRAVAGAAHQAPSTRHSKEGTAFLRHQLRQGPEVHAYLWELHTTKCCSSLPLIPSAVLPTSCALVSSDVSGDLPVPQKQLHVDILGLKD